jgi:hypothetical protein
MGSVGEGIILQRLKLGRGRTSTVALFYLARRARIKPNLKFEETAKKSIDQHFGSAMLKRFDEAMRTAK